MFRFKNNIKKFRQFNKNISVILFTNARDEPNIAEWVAHHLLLGFDKIIVFDHLSKIPIQKAIHSNFDNKLEIKRINTEITDNNFKITLMKYALELSNEMNYDWMLYLDADEFLCLNMNNISNIKQYLLMFKHADAIGINWVMFGTNGHKTQPKGLLTENFTKCEPFLNQHVKSFVKPYLNPKVTNPHFYIISNPSNYYSGNGTKMEMSPFNKHPIPFIKAPIYIAHYYTQSKEEHLRRKSRILDDGSKNKENIIMNEIDTIYNDVPNNQLQNKYSKKIRNFLIKYEIYYV